MSLAEQLRKLQIPGQPVIQQIASKNVSLLFDVRTAASLDNEAIQNIGLHGFKQLLLVDPVFSQFEQLFNASSLHFQRNLEHENISKKIKLKIRDYLLFLTPYLLLKPAQKTLEWLVRRYQCHIWDKDALLACILPFHESQLFGRIIQLFGTQPNNDSWDWLLTCQKEGAGFSTQSLINHCIENRNLLSFICEMADNAKEAVKLNPKSGLKIVFSFHARMLTSVVEATSVIGEDMLSFLLPFIHSGLKSHVRDFVCSTYMIITSLSSKTKLMKDVTKAILASILKSMEQLWYEEGLLCFISVLQFQNVKMLSHRIFELFLHLKSKKCIGLLETFGKEHDITMFVDLLIPLLCKCAVSIVSETDNNVQEKSVIILKSFIDNLNLSQNQVSMICRNVIGECIADEFHDLSNGIISQKIKELLAHLAKRYATIFDECIGSYFNEYYANKDKICLQRLKEITINCLSSEKHCIYGDSDLPLVLSLNHPEANIRIVAVQQLFATFKSEIDISDKSFFQDAVIARLNDDNADVVSAVLKYPKSIIKLLPGNILHKLVMKLMQSDGHYNINELIVALIQSFPVEGTSSEVNEFVYAVFGQLMFAFIGKRNKKLVEALDCVEFDSNNVILKGIAKALFHIPTRSLSKGDCTEEMVVSAFSSLVGYVADTLIADENRMDVVADLWNYLQQLSSSHDLQFIGLMLIIALVEKLPKLNVKIMELNFGKHLEQYFSSDKNDDLIKLIDNTHDDKKKYLFTQYYSCLKSDVIGDFNKLLDETFFTFLNIIIQSFVNNQHNIDGSILAKQKLFNILSAQSVNINSSQVSAYRNLLNQFLTRTFIDKEELLSFLCSMYMKLIEETKIDDESFKAAVCSLHITKRLLSKNDKGDIEKSDCIIYATHIALLSSPFPMIRKIVLDNIHVLSEIAIRTKVWGYVLKKAKESENEISVDPSHVKKSWQLSFAVKERSNFGRLIQKSKKGQFTDQKISSLHGLTKSIKNYPVSLQISLLDSLEFVDPRITMEDYIDLLKDVLHKSIINAEEINIVKLVLKCVRSEMFDSLEELFPLFVECITHNESVIQSSAFQLITPSFYNSMSVASKGLLLEVLLKILLSSNSVAISTEVRVIIKSLDLDTENIISLLQQFCDTFDQTYTTVASNTNDIQFDLEEDDVKIPMWRTLVELLEAVSYKETTNNPEQLVPKCFHILERCLKCSGVEYVKQLLLLTLHVITRQDLSKLSEDQFQVELLVQCLQSSKDTQTSHQCLLVLSNAARLYPTRVLHNIMHIFSFMGCTMLRLDNAYSFEIIEKTINAVVPVLIQKDKSVHNRKRPASSSIDEIVTFILQTFVDSIPHCPEHRRQHIIKHLVKLLQASEHLHNVMILLLKKVTLQHHKQVSEEENMELSPISLEFCKDLFSTYPIPTQVHSLYKMVAYINTMVVEKKVTAHKSPDKLSKDLLFDVNNKHVNLFKYTLISFTLEILQNEKMQSGYDVKPHKQEHLTHLYLQLVEELLSYADKLGKSVEETKSRNQVKSLHQKVSQVISQLYDLLPFDSFITIISKLLYKENELIRKKSLELLCKKLGTLEDLSSMQENTLIELCNTIMALVKYKEENDEGAVNKQLMLYAIKLIAIKLCKNQKEPFLKAVPVVAQLYTVEDSNEMLSINAMLCVAELSSLLKTDMLPYLPIIMKPLFAKISIKESVEYKKGDLFLSSSITILHTLLKSLPQFLSPYVSDFIMNVSSYDIIAGNLSDTALLQKIITLKADMGKLFPPRVLFPAIESCFDLLLKTKKEGTVSVVDVYRCSFKTISKSDANSNYSRDILNITKKIFDVHSVLSDEEDELGNTLENLTIQAFTDLILKLTENTLRPLYLELLNWSTEKSDISRRLLSFFRLSIELSKSLKNLFLLFVGHVLKNSKDVLAKVNTANEDFTEGNLGKQNFLKELVIAVLDTLSNCFFYDSQGFINKERFESIMQPLVNQMENKIHGRDGYLSFAKDHLSPCIVNFATAVNDSACWKQLNHQILIKTKSEDEQVRLASLYIIEKIYSRVGESYMILIPETIPFLAEILEDDSIEVEKQCQKVIQEIEEISGESIQKYF